MTREQFITIGLELFGPSWKRPLAAALGVGERQVYHWLEGRDFPADLPERLAVLCLVQSDKLVEIADQLRA
jgi:hypothetical protein